MNVDGTKHLTDDCLIFMNKQDFRDTSPSNYIKGVKKKNKQTSIFPQNAGYNVSPSTMNLVFTPFQIDLQINQPRTSRSLQKATPLQPLMNPENKQYTKQKFTNQHINRQLQLRKGAQFRKITLGKITQVIVQPKNQTEILNVTQKKINNIINDSQDQIFNDQTHNIPQVAFNGNRAFSNVGQHSNSPNNTFKEYTLQPISNTSHNNYTINDENNNNQILNNSSVLEINRQKKKNFRIQPTCNIGYLNQLYQKRFQIGFSESQNFDQNSEDYIDQDSSDIFQKYSEQKPSKKEKYLQEFSSESKSRNIKQNNQSKSYKVLKNQQDLKDIRVVLNEQEYFEQIPNKIEQNKLQDIESKKLQMIKQNSFENQDYNTILNIECQINQNKSQQNNTLQQFEKSLKGQQDQNKFNKDIFSPYKVIDQRKKQLQDFVKKQQQNNDQFQNQNNIQILNNSSQLKQLSYDESQQQKQNEFYSQQNSPKNSFKMPQIVGGFQTQRQEVLTPRDTLAKIKNKQNNQNICQTQRKDTNNNYHTNLYNCSKTEIIRKMNKEMLKKYKIHNSRGFPYEIQFDDKCIKKDKKNCMYENEKLESWEVEYRLDTAFGIETLIQL